MKTIGVIGTGIMGGGMARRLLSRGFPVVVYNRTAHKAAAIKELGASVAESPSDLASRCDTVIVCVRDDAALKETMLAPGGALSRVRPGTAFINTSTVTPAAATAVASAVAAKGCTILDVPLAGSRAAAEAGALILLVSGEQEVLDSQSDVLKSIGQSITYFGPIGRSAVFKLANNQLAAALVRAMGESIALCEAAGIDRAVAVEALSQTASRVCGLKKEKLAKRDWSTDFALELMYKDLTQAQQTAASLNVEMPLLEAVAGLYRQAARGPLGQKDFAAIAEPASSL
jgi:3-hydroxyisobutyrate dehydrogenase